jgi:hypothetical protein
MSKALLDVRQGRTGGEKLVTGNVPTMRRAA